MTTISIAYYSNDDMNFYSENISIADLDIVFRANVAYVIVECEQEMKFLFGILGKAEIHENNPMGVIKSLTLKGRNGNEAWVKMFSYIEAEIIVETPDHVFMMLNEIKKYDSEGFKKILKKVVSYRKRNHVHNYAHDYLIN